MITLSIIKADTGGFVGHGAVHPDMMAAARRAMERAVGSELVIEGHVASCGDDVSLIMTRRCGADSELIHSFAWETFQTTTNVARELGLYGAGQDLLSDAFSGNLRGMGPSYAELEFEERPSEPVVCFLADKTEPGAWNYPLYKMFADPFNTAGLVIDAKMRAGFVFEVYDLIEENRIRFDCPAEIYDMLMFIGAPARYVIHGVRSKTLNETAVATSTQRLSLIAGKYVGKDDPVMIVRAQSGLPALGEVLEPFAFPFTVGGSMRGSHHAPFMPTSIGHVHPARFDGPPRVVALGFQIHEGRLIGPRDLFADPSFDRAREQANVAMDYLRMHGPFEPHRLPLEDLEYTTMPQIQARIADRWEPLAAAPEPARSGTAKK